MSRSGWVWVVAVAVAALAGAGCTPSARAQQPDPMSSMPGMSGVPGSPVPAASGVPRLSDTPLPGMPAPLVADDIYAADRPGALSAAVAGDVAQVYVPNHT